MGHILFLFPLLKNYAKIVKDNREEPLGSGNLGPEKGWNGLTI